MNVKIPHSWLTEYVAIKEKPQQIASRLARCGISVERVMREEGEWIYDIEITTNRPDTFSVIGFAREVAAIFDLPFKDPLSVASFASQLTALKKKVTGARRKADNPYTLSISVKDKKSCRRYSGAIVDGVTVKESPAWMQKRLLLAGLRPINNLVDITNYVMLEYGQPMHAFDAARLTAYTGKTASLFKKAIVVRPCMKGEVLVTLDGEEKKLDPSMLAIADEKSVLALAGIKGGKDAGISNDTHTIIFESASFDPVSVRKTSRALDLRTDSSMRFEKNLSPEYIAPALVRALDLACELAGGVLVGSIVDVYPVKEKRLAYRFPFSLTQRTLGITVPKSRVKKILQSLGCTVSEKGEIAIIEVPFWRRSDISGEVDFVEEIARIYGYEQVKPEPLRGSLPYAHRSDVFAHERRTRNFFKEHGWTEVIHYSLVSDAAIRRIGYDPKHCVKLYNPLSSDMEYLRPSLLSSLLETAAENEQKAESLQLFEIGPVYLPHKSDDLPEEDVHCAGVLAQKGEAQDLFLAMKGILTALFREWFNYNAEHISFSRCDHTDSAWRASQTAHIVYEAEDKKIVLGHVGTLKKTISSSVGLKTPYVLFDLYNDLASRVGTRAMQFVPLPKYPFVLRDCALVVPMSVAYADLERALKTGDAAVQRVELFDMYEGDRIGSGKRSYAFHLWYGNDKRTLTSDEVESIHTNIIARLEKQFGAVLR